MKSTKNYLHIDKKKDKVLLVQLILEPGKNRVATNFHLLNCNIMETAFMLRHLDRKIEGLNEKGEDK
jgi:hypothetical protein